DIPPTITSALSPETEVDVSFQFVMPFWLVAGSYDGVTAVWNDFDVENNLMVSPRFDERTESSFQLSEWDLADTLELGRLFSHVELTQPQDLPYVHTQTLVKDDIRWPFQLEETVVEGAHTRIHATREPVSKELRINKVIIWVLAADGM
ncbi:MAG: hypothetical protein IH899_14800, partial [Planctomycetes bacterium]|nr:hypothetical protein [Planctomycetota bacterium]